MPVPAVTLPQAFIALHWTESEPATVTVPHAPLALHDTVHDSADVQLTLPHACCVPHVMPQCQPDGHEMLPLPVPVTLHVCVAKSHCGQMLGHTGGESMPASLKVPTTQKPWVSPVATEHTRPEPQLAELLHWRPSVRRSTVQLHRIARLAATPTATPVQLALTSGPRRSARHPCRYRRAPASP
jgi:hypothetical protein